VDIPAGSAQAAAASLAAAGVHMIEL
jgi:hypothetical protein